MYVKNFRIIKFSILPLLLLAASCNNLEYSPNQVFDKNSHTDINATNLRLLGDGAGDDTVRFVFTGDTQRSRNEGIDFYKKVNSMSGIDFIVLAGDISEFGVMKEMDWIAETFSHLNRPYVAVIGNHDLTSRGRDVFQRMFGQLNYSFTYGGVRFICHDTNGREYKFNSKVPDIQWLEDQLKPTEGVSSYIAMSHVPSNSGDFDSTLVASYHTTFSKAPKLLASLHAHTHSYDVYYPDNSGIPYIITASVEKKEFLIVEIINNKLSFERIYF
ncbi:MAG: metallophosphoesterase [Sphingobacteriales bacterium]|nr:MAG: metallophosphoesterase [Sphingobacteriales bacterium]